MTIPQLAADPKAMSTAGNLFQVNCAQCHGSDGGGARGFPNLADRNWQWGGDADSVVATIANGRVAAGMIAWGPVLGEQGVGKVVAYLQKLSGQQHDAALAAEGEQLFVTTGCIGCHGMDGKGMAALGAPDLTDDIWLYGGDAATLEETVSKGRAGQMPAFDDRLGAERVRLLAAYSIQLAGTSN
jgi:cytochrome c oxidase cbb3-type subunit 3